MTGKGFFQNEMVFPILEAMRRVIFPLWKYFFHFETLAGSDFRAADVFFLRTGMIFAPGRHLWIISTQKKSPPRVFSLL
jgi:hypothetical protein